MRPTLLQHHSLHSDLQTTTEITLEVGEVIS